MINTPDNSKRIAPRAHTPIEKCLHETPATQSIFCKHFTRFILRRPTGIQGREIGYSKSIL